MTSYYRNDFSCDVWKWGLNFFNLDSCKIKIARSDGIVLNKVQHLCIHFLFINSLTLAHCWDKHCVNDHMLPLSCILIQTSRHLSPLKEEILLIMPNLSGEMCRQIYFTGTH